MDGLIAPFPALAQHVVALLAVRLMPAEVAPEAAVTLVATVMPVPAYPLCFALSRMLPGAPVADAVICGSCIAATSPLTIVFTVSEAATV